MQIILASASPRRQELLKHIISDFQIQTSSCEENAMFTTPSEYVMELAALKAEDVATHYLNLSKKSLSDETLIIGADTIVYNEGHVLGKPKDRDAAHQMLVSLSGKSHEVYTGLALVHIKEGLPSTYTSFCCTHVHVNPLTEDEISQYIDGPENVYDKAGSYAIQGTFSRHIERIEGDYFNVVGLPVSKLYAELKSHNFL